MSFAQGIFSVGMGKNRGNTGSVRITFEWGPCSAGCQWWWVSYIGFNQCDQWGFSQSVNCSHPVLAAPAYWHWRGVGKPNTHMQSPSHTEAWLSPALLLLLRGLSRHILQYWKDVLPHVQHE